MSFQAMKWAHEQNLPDSESKLLLLVLANYAGHDDTCWPSVPRLARECVFSESTARRRLQQLAKIGFIRIETRLDKAGDQTSNLYHLLTLPPVSLTPPPCQPDTRGGVPGTPKPVSTEPVNEPKVGGSFEDSPRMVSMWDRWIKTRMGHRKPSVGWHKFFLEQSVWLGQFDEQTAFSILEKSVINDYQGLFPPKQPSTYQKPFQKKLSEKIADETAKNAMRYLEKLERKDREDRNQM